MAGLMDDDFGMELLVAGKIIDLSLPISDVYQGVWQPHVAAGGAVAPRSSGSGFARAALGRVVASAVAAGGQVPMVVTFRWVQGTDCSHVIVSRLRSRCLMGCCI